jgi:hypothetical protein
LTYSTNGSVDMTGPFFRFGIGLTDDEHKDLVAFLRTL